MIPDFEIQAAWSDEEEELGAKKIRPPRHVLKYEVVQRWVTGERAEKDEDVITTELETLMREYVELSSQRQKITSNREAILEARVLAYRQTLHRI